MSANTYPNVSKVEVMLTYELFDRSEEDAAEMSVDHEAMIAAAERIEAECRDVFPNAEFYWSADGEQYAAWFTHATGDDLTMGETYEIEEALQDIVDRHTIYYAG